MADTFLNNSAEGDLLQSICHEMGLRQLVREPTRENHLLDLVMTDIEGVGHEVGPKVADHNYVMASVEAVVPKTVAVKRTVWNYNRADWALLQDRLVFTDWYPLAGIDPEEGAKRMSETILQMAGDVIGKRTLRETKRSHPWLNERATRAVADRDRAEGTAQEQEAIAECSAVLKEERENSNLVRSSFGQELASCLVMRPKFVIFRRSKRKMANG